ncbi:MAG TPA: hypothetical protein VGD26_04795 [Chitinophagaceae bacterium]
MRKVTICSVFLLLAISCISQHTQKTKRPLLYGGPGFGLDYGGIGLKLEYLPVKWFGLFGGVGYNFNGLGTNVGISFKGFPDFNSTPVIMIMYGYNSIMKVNSQYGAEIFSETYYGFSAGAGYEFLVGKNENKISLAIIVPFRGSDFNNQYDEFINTGYTFSSNKPSVTFSVGFTFKSATVR